MFLITAVVARLFMSSFFVLNGYFKLTGIAGTVAYMGRQGLSAPTLVALGCTVYVLIAALIAHRDFGDGDQLSYFMKNRPRASA